MTTQIEWCDETWNPVIGCSKVSAGCDHCYAIREAHRLASNPHPTIGARYQGLTRVVNGRPNWTGMVRLVRERLDQPLHWRHPRRIFVNSMSDLLHEDVPWLFIDKILAVAALCPQHWFIVLTKRPDRLRRYFAIDQARLIDRLDDACRSFGACHGNLDRPGRWPLPNLCWGISAETQSTLEERYHELCGVPTSVRALSLEPLLGPIDLGRVEGCGYYCDSDVGHVDHPFWVPGIAAPIQWVIVGAESGPGARPMQERWVRAIRDQCLNAGVAFFYKQRLINGRKASLPELDGRQWAQFPTAMAGEKGAQP